MTGYTIAERQTIKDRLADERFFEQDRQLFLSLFPHHQLAGECKRVNNMNRLSLDRRMIYHMLTRVSEEGIMQNRLASSASEGTVSTSTARWQMIKDGAKKKLLCIKNWLIGFFNIRKPGR